MNDVRKTVLARVTGRVQGVAFRAWSRHEAERLGLTGWVRNEADGSVVALLQGPSSAVDTMTNLLRQGPPAARVEKVSVDISETPERYPDFMVRR